MSTDFVIPSPVDNGDMHWLINAACSGLPPGLFFGSANKVDARAKAACARCAVIDPCFERNYTSKHNFVAGLHAKERRKLSREDAKKLALSRNTACVSVTVRPR